MTITNQDVHDAINEQFTQYKRNKTSRADRMSFAMAITEQYFAEHDKFPPPALIDRMSTLILQDELAEVNEHKMSQNEFPLLSDRQQERRHGNEKSIKAAQDVAVDGTDYRVRTRDSNRRMRDIYR